MSVTGVEKQYELRVSRKPNSGNKLPTKYLLNVMWENTFAEIEDGALFKDSVVRDVGSTLARRCSH